MYDHASDRLKLTGAVGVIPTDTVYGVVARASDEKAVSRLDELKKREGKPGTLIAADITQLEDLGLKHRYLKAVGQFWPGSVSVVIPTSDPKLEYLHKGRMSLAVRIPAQKELRELLKKTGPLATSSANITGEPVAGTIDAARRYFGDQVDFYVDGGDLSGRVASTVVRIVDDAVEVLRQGAVRIDDDTMKQ